MFWQIAHILDGTNWHVIDVCVWLVTHSFLFAFVVDVCDRFQTFGHESIWLSRDVIKKEASPWGYYCYKSWHRNWILILELLYLCLAANNFKIYFQCMDFGWPCFGPKVPYVLILLFNWLVLISFKRTHIL